MDFKHFLLAVHLTDGIGLATENKVIMALNREDLRVESWDLAILIELLTNFSIRLTIDQLGQKFAVAVERAEAYTGHFLTYFDAAYPERLREIYQPPLILFYRGDLRALQLPALAVVGTRTATPYGLTVVRQLLPPVVKSGCAIVSGLAKGIDVMAHQLTFAEHGVPIAVIGTGLDQAYPKHHRLLQEQIGRQGLLLSEFPLGVGPHKSHFPLRNRIIAGLAGAALVVEAREHSGSLITANLALQANRAVLAVPGPIDALDSVGCNQLIAAGALPVLTSSDIIGAIQWLP